MRIQYRTDARERVGTYNSGINKTNEAIKGFNTKLKNLNPQFESLNFNQLWDDPKTTDINENKGDELRGTLEGIQKEFEGLNLTPEQPTINRGYFLTPTEQRDTGLGYNQEHPLWLDEFAKIDRGVHGETATLINDLFGRLNEVEGERGSEINRLTGLFNPLNVEAENLVQKATDAPLTEVETIREKIGDLIARGGKIESPILQQTDFLNKLNEIIAGATGPLDLKSKQIAHQEGRFTNDEKNLNRIYEDIQAKVDALTPGKTWNADTLAKLRERITGEQTRLDKLPDLYDINIDTAPQREVLGGFLEKLSQLELGQEGYVESERQRIAAEARAKGLGEIRDSISNAVSNLPETDFTQEADLNKMVTNLTKAGQELSNFSAGDDVAKVAELLRSSSASVEEKLTKLRTTRISLERELQNFDKRIAETPYYELSNVEGEQAKYDIIKQRVEKHNAQNAIDELRSVEQRIMKERNRLERDERIVRTRDETAAQRVRDAVAQGKISTPIAQKATDYHLISGVNRLEDEDFLTGIGQLFRSRGV